MIGIVLLAVVQGASGAAAVPPGPAATGRCRGVHMPSSTGGANLLWTTIRGPEEKLGEIGKRMAAIGARISARSPTEIVARYTDDLDATAIGRLLNRIDAGEFGAVTAEDFAMSLDTLPADKCIRFRRRP
ncbi:MAG TPA: hypothetical protein VFQ67_09570 [Allosphingosinicella sp.]|jgi:hypothetical protein|nr:hypothetical protein [Allosphingosinicella sp.]